MSKSIFLTVIFFLLIPSGNAKGDSFSLKLQDETEYDINYQLLSDSSPTSLNYEHIPLKTEDNIDFDAYFVNNQSNTVIVLGHGFQNNCDDMKDTAQLFNPCYDIMIFNYRWAHQLKSYTFRWNNLKNPTKALLTCEKNEIKAVVDYLRARKKYKRVIGLGQCYSAITFIHAQEDAVINSYSLFDKIICDSPPSSISDLFSSVMKDPMLPFNSKKGGFPSFIRKFLINDRLINACKLGFKITNTDFSLDKALGALAATPMLFFHSKQDKLVPFDTFKKVWDAKSGEKALCLTPYYHVEHRNNPGIYTVVCKAFIESSPRVICEQTTRKPHIIQATSMLELLSPYIKKRTSISSCDRGNLFKRIRKKLCKY